MPAQGPCAHENSSGTSRACTASQDVCCTTYTNARSVDFMNNAWDLLQWFTTGAIFGSIACQMMVYLLVTDITDVVTVGKCVNGIADWDSPLGIIPFNKIYAVAILMSAIHLAQEGTRKKSTIRSIATPLPPDFPCVKGYWADRHYYNCFFVFHAGTLVCHWLVYGVIYNAGLTKEASPCYRYSSDIHDWALAAAVAYTAAVVLQIFHAFYYICNYIKYGKGAGNDQGGYPKFQFGVVARNSSFFSMLFGLGMLTISFLFFLYQLKVDSTCTASGPLSVEWFVVLMLSAYVAWSWFYGLTSTETGKQGNYQFAVAVNVATCFVLFIVAFQFKWKCITPTDTAPDHIRNWLRGAAVYGWGALLWLSSREDDEGKIEIATALEDETKEAEKVAAKQETPMLAEGGVPEPVGGKLRLRSRDMQTLRLTTDGPDTKASTLQFV